jgi:ElaB/YqjD/DUF883 family membrane-anchored ribosome-binding protein
MPTILGNAKPTGADGLGPALDSVKASVHQAQRAITYGTQAADDALAATALKIRRQPLTSMAVAGAVGALLGCLLGFAAGRSLKRCT